MDLEHLSDNRRRSVHISPCLQTTSVHLFVRHCFDMMRLHVAILQKRKGWRKLKRLLTTSKASACLEKALPFVRTAALYKYICVLSIVYGYHQWIRSGWKSVLHKYKPKKSRVHGEKSNGLDTSMFPPCKMFCCKKLAWCNYVALS